MQSAQKYTWKAKNKILLIGSFAFTIVVYQLAIKKTMNARNLYLLQQKSLETRQITLQGIEDLKQQIGSLTNSNDAIHAKNFFETEYMVSLAHDKGVLARNLSEATVVTEDTRNIVYSAYYFSGSFIKLLKLLDHAEKQTAINVLNARFYKEKNQISRKTELVMKLETATIN